MFLLSLTIFSLLVYLLKIKIQSRFELLKELLDSSNKSHEGIKSLAAEVAERSVDDVEAQIASKLLIEPDGLYLVDLVFLCKDGPYLESK
jgi:hypothetical protein